MSDKKNPLDGLSVVEPGQGADAQPSVFVGEQEVANPGEPFPNELPEGTPSDAGLITQQQFYDTMFCGLFAAPQMFGADFAPIAIQEHEKPIARPASDAAYALLKIYYPSFLTPGSETMAHLIAMFPFVMLKFMVIREIIKTKRAEFATRNDTTGAGEGQSEGEGEQ